MSAANMRKLKTAVIGRRYKKTKLSHYPRQAWALIYRPCRASGAVGMSLLGKRTVSAAVLAANRINAKKSTGPGTWRGRQLASLNSLKHALRSRSLGIGSFFIPVGTRVIPAEAGIQFLVTCQMAWSVDSPIAEPGAPACAGITAAGRAQGPGAARPDTNSSRLPSPLRGERVSVSRLTGEGSFRLD